MSRRREWLQAAMLATAHALWGCDGVGRALVEGNHPGVAPDLQCMPFDCREVPLTPVPDSIVSDVEPVLEACSPPDPAACEPVSETAPSFGLVPLGCRRTLALDDDALDRDAVRELECSNVRLVRTAAGAPASLRLESVEWRNSEVEVESATELELELADAVINRVRLRLRGPVTLRVVDSTEVSAVTLESDVERAQVDFHTSTAKQIKTGGSRAFAGVLSSTRSTLTEVDIAVRELRFETVALERSRIDAERLQWVDVTSRIGELEFETGLVSASRMRHLDVRRCGALGLYNTDLKGFRLPACDVPMRVVQTGMDRGSIDGEIVADESRFNRTLFGLHAPTDLQLWDGQLNDSNFCAGTDRVAIAGFVSGQCTECEELDGSTVPVDACLDADSELLMLRSCHALEMPKECRPTLERMRPPFD